MIKELLVSYGAISAAATIGYLAWGWALAERRSEVIDLPMPSVPFHSVARRRSNGGRRPQVSRSFATNQTRRRLNRRAHLLAPGRLVLSANSPGGGYLRGAESW
jgi:hypothetical protein